MHITNKDKILEHIYDNTTFFEDDPIQVKKIRILDKAETNRIIHKLIIEGFIKKYETKYFSIYLTNKGIEYIKKIKEIKKIQA